MLSSIFLFAQEHDCKLTREIVELIDREADLLIRGVKESNLEGLRKRIVTLFLQYIKNPTFNPQVSKLLPVCIDVAHCWVIYFSTMCLNLTAQHRNNEVLTIKIHVLTQYVRPL